MVTPANAKALTGRTRPPLHKGEVERKDGVVPKVTVAERVDAAHMRGEDLSELSVAKLGELENRVSTALKNIQRKKAFRMAEQMQQKEVADLKACCICLTKDKCILFQPCKHICTCEECARNMSDCPICRKPIRNYVQVFL